MKQIIRLTESDLHGIIMESVNRLLNEIGDTPRGQMALGALKARKAIRDNDNSSDIYNYARNARGGDNWSDDYSKGFNEYVKSHPTPKLTDPQLYAQVKDAFIKALEEQKPTFTSGGYMQFDCDGYEFELDDIPYDVDVTRYAYDEPDTFDCPGGWHDAEGDVYPCIYSIKGDTYMGVSINGGEWMDMLMDEDMKDAVDQNCSMDSKDIDEVLNSQEPDYYEPDW